MRASTVAPDTQIQVHEPRRLALARLDLVCAVVLVLVLVAFVQQALAGAQANWDVGDGDQGGYLRLALKTHAGNGFANARYHPLLSLLLQPIVTRDWSFFTNAKLMNIGLAALGLLAVYGLGRLLFGPIPALLAAAALSINTEFVERAGRTEPEVLLTGLFFAAWATWTLGFRQHRYWWLAGVLAGLTFLAKGTGQFFLIGFLLVPLLRYGPRGLMSRWPWTMVGLYYLVGLPLFITNIGEYGSPFYDFNSAHALWYDTWDDRYGSPSGDHITLGSYLATHSVGQIAERVISGVIALPRLWGAALALNLPWSGAILALVAVGLAGGGWLASRRGGRDFFPTETEAATFRDAAWTFGALFVPTYLLFAWFLPVTASPRFLLPLVPIVYMLLAVLARVGVGHLVSRPIDSWVPPLVGAATVFSLVTHSWVSPTALARSDLESNAASVAVFDKLTQVVPTGETVIWGPGDLGTWPFYGLASFEPIPTTAKDWPAFWTFTQNEEAHYIILAPDMVSRRPLLHANFRVQDKGVAFDQLPDGWSLVYAYPDLPCRYCLFALEPK